MKQKTTIQQDYTALCRRRLQSNKTTQHHNPEDYNPTRLYSIIKQKTTIQQDYTESWSRRLQSNMTTQYHDPEEHNPNSYGKNMFEIRTYLKGYTSSTSRAVHYVYGSHCWKASCPLILEDTKNGHLMWTPDDIIILHNSVASGASAKAHHTHITPRCCARGGNTLVLWIVIWLEGGGFGGGYR
jgi:hypothetical protein